MSFSVRSLLTLAWPIIVARMSQAVIGFSDALMTAPLGDNALAATTTGAINTFTAIIFWMGLVFIVQSFASQFAGRGDFAGAGRALWYGIFVAVLAQLVAFVAMPLVGPITGQLTYAPEVRELMVPFIKIRLFVIGPIIAIEAMGAWFGGLGNTRPHMLAGVLAMVTNVFLNWVLIYGHLGMPALGVKGSAIASSIASTLAFIFMLVVCWTDKRAPGSPFRAKLSMREFVRFMRFGLPNGVNWFLEFFAITVFINVIVAALGTVTLAAMMVVFNINSVSFMPGFGLSSAGAILAGQAIGAGRPDDVPKILLRTSAVAMVWEGTVGLFYLFLPTQLMGLFAPADKATHDLITIGAGMLMMSSAWQIFDAIATTVSEALRAAGDTNWVMWARITIAWLVFMPLSWFTVPVLGGGHMAAITCIVVYMIMLAGVLFLRFNSGRWRRINLTGASPSLTPAS